MVIGAVGSIEASAEKVAVTMGGWDGDDARTTLTVRAGLGLQNVIWAIVRRTLAVAKQVPQAQRVTVTVVVSRQGVVNQYGDPVAEDITLGEVLTPDPWHEAHKHRNPPLEEVRKYTTAEFYVRSVPSLFPSSEGRGLILGQLLRKSWLNEGFKEGLTGYQLIEGHIVDCPVGPAALSYCKWEPR